MRFSGRTPRLTAVGGRLLRIELLERRDLLAVIRLVDWNAANHPNDAGQITDFTTILQAIGNETVAGNTKRLDILALQETDVLEVGNNSIGQIETILESLYPSINYSFAVTEEDGGGDATGFVYDTTTVSLLESTTVSPESFTHNILRAKFRPVDTLGDSDFFVYTVHLKSGDTGPDADLRGMEALALRSDIVSLGEGAQVLTVGDFNMKTSSETAYGTLIAEGAGQVLDVVAAPGDWNGNILFRSLHSQDPGTNMDDRFDIHFASSELFDDVGLDYVASSYHVFGNNGTHTLGMPITTGSGASPTVLAALANASDHLPVIADYEVVPSTPNVRITETGGGTKVIEGGFYDTYYVVLDTVPEANVSVTVTPNSQLDVGNGAGVSRILTFTPANALTPQVVVVNAANDGLGEGNHTGLISHSAASSDSDYDEELTIASVTATIVDNDAPTIVINEVDADTPGSDMMEFVELYDGGVGNSSLNGKTVVFFNGTTDLAYATFNLAGLFTDANGFFVLGNPTVSGVDLGFTNNTLQNGADAVALYSGGFLVGQSVTTANLLDAIVYDNGEADDAGLLVLLEAGQPQVNENQNSAGDTQSLSRMPDGGTPRVTSSYVAQAPTPGALNKPPAGGALIVQSGSRVDIAEGGATDSYQIALSTIPTSNVTVTVDPDGQTNLGAGAGVAIMLTFTPANALIPQTVTVTAVDDVLAEGAHASTITHVAASADSAYNGLMLGNVVASITDNDFAAPPVIVITEIMYNPASNEGGLALPEWIEVVNAGSGAVDLGGWVFDDEDSSNWGPIPLGTVLNPGQLAVFFDSDLTSASTFRTEWTVPASALVVGLSWGSLVNDPSGPGDEELKLLNGSAAVMDVVNFDNSNPWPSISSSPGGPSIYLKSLTLDNNSGANWARSATGAARAVSPTGPTFSTSDIGSPGRFFLPGDYNVNGYVDLVDYVVWRDTLGSSMDLRADGSGPTVGTPNGVVDQADYTFWRANFGNVGAYYTGGAGAGAGDVVAAVVATSSAVSSPPLSLLSEPQSMAISGGAEEPVADAMVVQMPLEPVRFASSAAAKSVLPTASLQVAHASAGLLLVAVHGDASPRHLVEMDATFSEWSDVTSDGVDAFFASLDELELTAVGSRAS